LGSLHKIPVSVLFLLFSSLASGGDPYFTPAGAAEAGMNYSCTMKQGFWSSFHNQALLADHRNLSAGISYENRFNISELGTRSAALILPAGKSTLGAFFSNFGYRDFMRQTAGISCGMRVSEKLSAGVQIDYFGEGSPGEYAKRHDLTFEAGVLLLADDNITIGIHLFNPVPNSLRKSYLPSSIRVGAGIKLSEVLFASSEIQAGTAIKLTFRTGFEYESVKNFRIRGGFCTENTSFSFGCGYGFKPVTIDLGFVTHERLGITSSASLIFRIK